MEGARDEPLKTYYFCLLPLLPPHSLFSLYPLPQIGGGGPRRVRESFSPENDP